MQHSMIIITHASMTMCPKRFDEAFQIIRDFVITEEVSASDKRSTQHQTTIE